MPVFLYFFGVTWWGIFFFALTCYLSSVGITGGYHRLLAHRSYEASAFLRGLYLFLGAGNFQGSALQWATDHRRHHRFEDSNEDPYSINKGFWYAHIGWLFYHDTSPVANHYPPDLTRDKLVMFQHNHYVWIAIASGFLVPCALGALWGNAWGGLIICGLLRIVFCQHSTFLINSLSHFAGKQTFTLKASARDNVLMAFLAYGEGWHSFHHKFQSDYRNGFRWYHWDPTKWWIASMRALGQAGRLKRISDPMILEARMQVEQAKLLEVGVPEDRLTALKSRFESAQNRFWTLYGEYKDFKRRMGAQSKQKLIQLRAELRVAKLERKAAFAQWCAYVRTMRALPAYR